MKESFKANLMAMEGLYLMEESGSTMDKFLEGKPMGKENY